MLKWLRDQANAGGRGAIVIETLALEALTLARAGEQAQARERLDQALALAAPEGFVGLFVDLGPPLADLLTQSARRRAQHDPIQDYIRRLLAVFGGEKSTVIAAAEHDEPHALGRALERSHALQEMLTERELEVLRLFAAGMTSPEIAEHFVVSINTVKTQLKSIYSKLDAHSRAEAITKARAHQILP